MRYRITAWGSDTHPPIDEKTDIDPMPMVAERGYRFVSCQLLTLIPYNQIMARLHHADLAVHVEASGEFQHLTIPPEKR